jgi:hypothetical protein
MSHSYVRIRRKQQTFYVCIPSDVSSADYLKDEIITALSGLRHESDADTSASSTNRRYRMHNDNDYEEDEEDDATENPNALTRQDLKIMDTAGTELLDRDQVMKLVNEQELHVVFRLSEDEFEPVQVQYADMAE